MLCLVLYLLIIMLCLLYPYCLHVCLSRTWRDRLLGAATGATLTLVTLWLVLVSAAAAAVILHA